MPNSTYKALKDPPGLYDRLLAHPEEAGLALFNFTISVFLVLSPWLTPSVALSALPFPLVLALGTSWGLGGVLTLAGIFWRGRMISHGWALEKIGLLLAMGGWLAYALVINIAYPTSVIAYGFGYLVGAIALLRVIALVRLEKVTRRTLKSLSGEKRS